MAKASADDCPPGSEVQPLLSESLLTPEVDCLVSNENESDTENPKALRKVLLRISFLLLGDFIGNADEFFLLAVYEKIASEFLHSGSAIWIVLAESLAYMIALPIYGFLSDRYGSKRPILGSYIILVIGAILTSISNNFWMVVFSRIVSGLAVAGMFTMTTIVIVANAEPSDVGVLRSYANIFAALGRNTGPTIGGLLTNVMGWRKSFLCEIPFVVVCFMVVGMFFDSGGNDRKTSDNEESRVPSTTSEQAKEEPVDITGMILFDMAIIAFVVAIKQFGDNSDTAKFIVGCSMAAFGLLSFVLVLRERSVGKRAFVPLHIFRSRLGLQFLLQFCWMFVILSLLTILPVYFSRVTNATAADNALHLLPLTISTMLGNLFAGRLMKIFNRYKMLMHVAMLIAAIGFFLTGFRWRGPVSFGESLYVFIAGFGGGMFQASSFVAISMNIEEKRKGAMIGFFFLAAEIGGFIGLSASSTIVNLGLKRVLLEKGPDVPHRAEIIQSILQDSSFAFTLPEIWQQLASNAFIEGFRRLMIALGALAVVIQSLILVIREKLLDQ